MVDECSAINGRYWDATSITSDSTTANDLFHTPTGSLEDLKNSDQYNDNCDVSRTFTPTIHDMKLMENAIQLENDIGSIKLENDNTEVDSECLKKNNREPPTRPPPFIRQQTVVSSSNESESTVKKRNWKQDFVRKLSFTRSRIMKSFSIQKSNGDFRSTGNIFKSMRHSISHMRSFDKRSRLNRNGGKNVPESVSTVIGSDCEYFNFERDLNSPDVIRKNDQCSLEGSENEESTPLKPRRIFKQEKYLTGSKEILQKAFSSLKRKSQTPDNKSLLDIYSTVSYLFSEQPLPNELTKETSFRKLIEDCVNSFIDVHKNQIEKSIILINESIGEDIDLYSQDLNIINKSKKYKITELYGSKGICMITNVINKKQFVALKKTGARSWIVFTGFLQHIDKCDNILPNQEWICFPVQSVTNLFIEKNVFNYIHEECKLLLDAIIQIIVILYCQMIDNFNTKMNPSNILLMTSELSIIFVIIESIDQEETDCIEWINCCETNEKQITENYHNLLLELNNYVERFLHSPENSSHLISASYPLDYLFFILLKLKKSIGLILNTL